jgi:hypothetical protein
LPQDPHNLPFEYIILKKHGLASGWVLLMASTEIPSASNRVVKPWATTLQEGNISSTDDIADITLCDDITSWEGVCNYSDSSQLRYISIL